MATNTYFSQGTVGEQGLTQDLVDEQIKMFGNKKESSSFNQGIEQVF